MGRRESRSEKEKRIIERAKEMIKEIGFEKAMLLLYEAAMMTERDKYKEENPEDLSNG